jgi:hypothetical protein
LISQAARSDSAYARSPKVAAAHFETDLPDLCGAEYARGNAFLPFFPNVE